MNDAVDWLENYEDSPYNLKYTRISHEETCYGDHEGLKYFEASPPERCRSIHARPMFQFKGDEMGIGAWRMRHDWDPDDCAEEWMRGDWWG